MVKDRAIKIVIMEGTRKGDLYALGALKWEAFFSNQNRSASEEVWHWRWGHLQSKVVRFLNNCDIINVLGIKLMPFVLVIKLENLAIYLLFHLVIIVMNR